MGKREVRMRFLYALIAIVLWTIIVLSWVDSTNVSADIKFLALAIVFAGALAVVMGND